MFPGLGLAINDMWRVKQIDYSRLRAMSDNYISFSDLTRNALEATLVHHAVSFQKSDLDDIMSSYSRGIAFTDVHPLLSELSLPWSILTNGNREFIHPMLVHAGIHCDENQLLTSDQVTTFKVNPRMYQLAFAWAQRFDSATKSDLIFVSSNQWDAIAATWFGFTTCWVNRTGQTPDVLGARPHREIRDLSELITEFDLI